MKFCNRMGLDDPGMAGQPPEARNYFLACYAVSLIQGQTIKGVCIKHSTLKLYMKEALAIFVERRLPHDSKPDFLAIITKAHSDYENVPNRRRMITDGMMAWLIKQADNAPLDSEIRAIVDWIIVGRYTGYRSSEWCQECQKDYARINGWPGDPALATTRNDFAFLGNNERRITQERHLTAELVHHLTCTWRHQKNGDNGQDVTFSGDRTNRRYCIVTAGLRIYHRSKRLGMKDGEPMGVCRIKGKVRFITSRKVTALLREAAQQVLGLDKCDPELKLWSTHSIRVTAANLLHRMQFSDSFIMKRLRWNSDRFLMYLRNTIHAADAQTRGINIKLSPRDQQSASYRRAEPHETIAQSHAAAA